MRGSYKPRTLSYKALILVWVGLDEQVSSLEVVVDGYIGLPPH